MTNERCLIAAYVIGLGVLAFAALKLWVDLRAAARNQRRRQTITGGGVS